MLAAGWIAQWLDGDTPHVWAGIVAGAGTIAVLAHLADDWRAGSDAIRSVHILLVHLALLALIAVAYQVIRRFEDGRSTGNAHTR